VARLADQAATSQPDQQEFVSLVHRAHKLAGGNPAAPIAK
jgi:hypothetical protein